MTIDLNTLVTEQTVIAVRNLNIFKCPCRNGQNCRYSNNIGGKQTRKNIQPSSFKHTFFFSKNSRSTGKKVLLGQRSDGRRGQAKPVQGQGGCRRCQKRSARYPVQGLDQFLHASGRQLGHGLAW